MALKGLIVAAVIGVIAAVGMLPPTHVSAASQATGSAVQSGAAQVGLDMVQAPRTISTPSTDFFPSCFTFFSFCSSFSFNRFNNCFGFFSFGCRTFNSFNRFPFFPFFRRFNSFFNNVSCIRIMTMPGGGTITVSIC